MDWRTRFHPGVVEICPQLENSGRAGRALLDCAAMARHGTIAITDYDWYSFLSQRRSWDEVNFWKPTTTHAFEPLNSRHSFSSSKLPIRAIAGFGYFARYSELPEWMAWDCFGPANGSAHSRRCMHDWRKSDRDSRPLLSAGSSRSAALWW